MKTSFCESAKWGQLAAERERRLTFPSENAMSLAFDCHPPIMRPTAARDPKSLPSPDNVLSPDRCEEPAIIILSPQIYQNVIINLQSVELSGRGEEEGWVTHSYFWVTLSYFNVFRGRNVSRGRTEDTEKQAPGQGHALFCRVTRPPGRMGRENNSRNGWLQSKRRLFIKGGIGIRWTSKTQPPPSPKEVFLEAGSPT